jgi:HlyD family secretion protein
MKRLLPVLAAVVLLAAGLLVLRHDGEASRRFTGFVEGEERVLRSEVNGRVLEVAFQEGDAVEAGAVVARLDPTDIDARVASARRELDVLARQIDQAVLEADLREASWTQDLVARETELGQAKSDLELAERTATREEGLARSGATTRQMLDDTRGRRTSARSAVERAAAMLAKTRAEQTAVAAARARVDVLRSQKELAASRLAELEVTRAKFEIRAPGVPTVVQTRLLWPGELAQPGTPVLSVLDPRDKYVQIYVPVPDLARVRVGSKVELELDSTPDRRWPGEVSFVADRANFTPEKIETRADRVGQVYRAKVRILEGVEGFAAGAECDVFLKDEAAK